MMIVPASVMATFAARLILSGSPRGDETVIAVG
jgi:hypothetical protein